MLSFFHPKVYFFPERLRLYLEARLQKHRWFVFALSAAYNKNCLEDLYQAGCGFLMCILYQASKKQTWDKNQLVRTVMQVSQPQPLAIHNTHKLSLICVTSQYVGWVLRAWQDLMESLGSATASETWILDAFGKVNLAVLRAVLFLSASPSAQPPLLSVRSDSSFDAWQ